MRDSSDRKRHRRHPEVKLGVPYLIPVNPIVRYKHAVDENMAPVAEVPAQDAGPWQDALEHLLTDREHHAEISRQSRTAALEYARNVSVEQFERFLENVIRSPTRSVVKAASPRLSADKQRLLALRLKQRAQKEDAWFPNVQTRPERPRLFCFPYAGGGALSYWPWIAPLAPDVSLSGKTARRGDADSRSAAGEDDGFDTSGS